MGHDRSQADAAACLSQRENLPYRGFGAGKWNGVGGKLDLQKGDRNVTDTAIRETEEEIGVKIKELEKVAVLNFYFPNATKEKEWNQEVHVFLVKDWEGEPSETEEMAPKWFKKSEIPFGEMWVDDQLWLSYVLEGKKLKADFVFSTEEIIDKHNVQFVEEI